LVLMEAVMLVSCDASRKLDYVQALPHQPYFVYTDITIFNLLGQQSHPSMRG
jgi:hypothetical protein